MRLCLISYICVTRKVFHAGKNKSERIYQNYSSFCFNSLNSNSGFKLKSLRTNISFETFCSYPIFVNSSCNLFEIYYIEYNMQIYFLKTFSGTDLHKYSMIIKSSTYKRKTRVYHPGPSWNGNSKRPFPTLDRLWLPQFLRHHPVLFHHGRYHFLIPPRWLSSSYLRM